MTHHYLGNAMFSTILMKIDLFVEIVRILWFFFFEIIIRFSGLSTFKCSESGFYKNEKGIVVVYTDGAAPSNGKRNAAGVAIGRSGCGVFFNEIIQSSFYNPSG